MEKLVAKFKATPAKNQMKFLQSNKSFLVYYSDILSTQDDSFAAGIIENFLTSCQHRIEQREQKSTEIRHMFNGLLSKKTDKSTLFLSQFLNYLQILRLQDHTEEAAAYYQSIQHYLQLNNYQSSVQMLFQWLLQNFDLFKLKFLLNCISPLIVQKEMYADVLNWFSAYVSSAVIIQFKETKQYVNEEYTHAHFAIQNAEKLLSEFAEFSPDVFGTFLDSSDLTMQTLKIFESCLFRLGDDPVCMSLNVYAMLYLLDTPYQTTVTRILISYMNHRNCMQPTQQHIVQMTYLRQCKLKFSLDVMDNDQEEVAILATYVFNRCFEQIAMAHYMLFVDTNMNKLVAFLTQLNQVLHRSPEYCTLFNPIVAYKFVQMLMLVVICQLSRPLDSYLIANQLPEYLQNQNLITQLINSAGEIFRRFFIQSSVSFMRLFSNSYEFNLEAPLTLGQQLDAQKSRLKVFGILTPTGNLPSYRYFRILHDQFRPELQDLTTITDFYTGICHQCINNRTILQHVEFTKLCLENFVAECQNQLINKSLLIDFAFICHGISKKFGFNQSKIATFNILTKIVLQCKADISSLKKQVYEKVLIKEVSSYLGQYQSFSSADISELGGCIVNVIDQFDVSEEVEFVAAFKHFLEFLDVSDVSLSSVYIQLYRYYVRFSEFEINKPIHEKLLRMLNADFLDTAADEQFMKIIRELKALLIMVVQQPNFADFIHQFQAFLAIYMFPAKIALLSKKKVVFAFQLQVVAQLVFDVSIYQKATKQQLIVPLTELKAAIFQINDIQSLTPKQRQSIVKFLIFATLCFENQETLIEDFEYGRQLSTLFGSLKLCNRQFGLAKSQFLFSLAIQDVLIAALFQIDKKFIVKVLSITGNEFFVLDQVVLTEQIVVEDFLTTFIEERYQYYGRLIAINYLVEQEIKTKFTTSNDFSGNHYLVNELISDFS